MPRLTVHARRALVQERRQQILTAAARVFADKGFDRATVRDIARAAWVAEGSIYNYFRDKRELLVHVPGLFIQSPIQAFQAAAASADGAAAPEQLLSQIVRSMVQIVKQNEEIVRVLITTLPLMDDRTRAEYFREVPAVAMSALETYIRAQQAAGVFRADLDPAITARTLPGMMMFFLLLQELLQPPDLPRIEYDRVVPTIVRIFLHGVLEPPADAARERKASPPRPGRSKRPARKPKL
jgi:AcrR family transcriptional regulator